MDLFATRFGEHISASAGPRYFGFVTGGSTPAAIAGDWLASAHDQNAAGIDGSITGDIERESILMLRDLFGLPAEFDGAFVSGATMSNFVGLALARQWAGHQVGINIAVDGMTAPDSAGHIFDLAVLSGAPHSCIFKAMSMLGMGRHNLQIVQLLHTREAIDTAALRGALAGRRGRPTIVVANAGTVNSVDFDNIVEIVALKREYDFWLHIDAAFGGFAALSPRHAQLLGGWHEADSIAIDLHKWLNVPYDSAVQFSRHKHLQLEVFQNAASYLSAPNLATPGFIHLTPENSRRLRALPAWMALMAYGREGHAEIVERCCSHARLLAARITQSSHFKMLAPARMNVVCFTLADAPSTETLEAFAALVRDSGDTYLTPTVYLGTPALRVAFSNWRTTSDDVAVAWRAMCKAADAALALARRDPTR